MEERKERRDQVRGIIPDGTTQEETNHSFFVILSPVAAPLDTGSEMQPQGEKGGNPEIHTETSKSQGSSPRAEDRLLVEGRADLLELLGSAAAGEGRTMESLQELEKQG